MKERRLDCEISQRRSPKFVNVAGLLRNIEVPEILVPILGKFTGGVSKRNIAGACAKLRRNLRNSRDMVLEVAKQFIRSPGDGMTLNAIRLPKEEQAPALLGVRH